jgi:hypothetical protein
MGNLFCRPYTSTRRRSIDDLTKINFAINTCIVQGKLAKANALLDCLDEEDRNEILKTFDRRYWEQVIARAE